MTKEENLKQMVVTLINQNNQLIETMIKILENEITRFERTIDNYQFEIENLKINRQLLSNYKSLIEEQPDV